MRTTCVSHVFTGLYQSLFCRNRVVFSTDGYHMESEIHGSQVINKFDCLTSNPFYILVQSYRQAIPFDPPRLIIFIDKVQK